METESPLSTPQPGPATQSDASPSTDRRKSGRVTRRPELYSQRYSASNGATSSGAKRKRAATADSNDEGEEGEQSEDHASESDDIESADEEPDEEELREQKRAARKASSKKQTSGSSKSKSNKSQSSRSAKKPKVAAAAGNSIGRQLALRPATNGKRSRPKQMKARLTMAARQGGLYGKHFNVSNLAWPCDC